jgi:hypothetical protein
VWDGRDFIAFFIRHYLSEDQMLLIDPGTDHMQGLMVPRFSAPADRFPIYVYFPSAMPLMGA